MILVTNYFIAHWDDGKHYKPGHKATFTDAKEKELIKKGYGLKVVTEKRESKPNRSKKEK